MDIPNRSNRNYESKHESSKGDSHKLLEELWTTYSKKGPRFTSRDFEHIFSAIKNNGASEDQIKSLKTLFRKELDQVKKYSSKYAKKILNEVGKTNLTDSQVFEYVQEQCKKHSFSRPITDAIYREVSHRLSEYPARSSYFRFTPPKSTIASTSLGFNNNENYSNAKVGNNDKTIINDIMRLNEANKMTHDFVIKQALGYVDCDFAAISGTFIPHRHNLMHSVHPVIAALFIPKITILEETMLFSSLSNIVKARVNNEPIITRPDYELFYNLCTDKNEYVCSSSNVWEDLKGRALIQVALWKSVLNLRSGRYYEDAINMAFLNELNLCKYYKYDAIDLTFSDDAGDIIRRLMYTFSFKPIYVQTLPVLPQTPLTVVTPFSNLDLYNGEMDCLPMINLRLNNLHQNVTIVNMTDIINDYEVYFDSSNNLVVPKMTKVCDSRGIVIVYVHRRHYALQINRLNGPFVFNTLPKTELHNYRINSTSVETGTNMTIANTSYDLRSVVCLNTITVDDRDVISGHETLIQPLADNDQFAVSEWLVYNPTNVNKYVLDENNNQFNNNTPFISVKWCEVEVPELGAGIRAATKGIIYVFTKSDEPVNC